MESERAYELTYEQIADFCDDAIAKGEPPTRDEVESCVGEYAVDPGDGE